MAVEAHNGSWIFRSVNPMIRAKSRYSVDADAMLLPRKGSTNVLAVTSVNAAMMYTSENHKKKRKRINAFLLIVALMTSAMERPWWRMEATTLTMSCTPPIKIPPKMTHRKVGNQPNHMPARIGPTIGPAAAMAERCWPKR